MRAHSLRRNFHSLLYVTQWVCGTVAGLITAVGQTEPNAFGQFSPTLEPVRSWSLTHKWLAPVLTGCLGLIQIAKREVGDPWVWDGIKHTIDTMQEHAFAGLNAAQGKHTNRVTLFKYVGWHVCWRRKSRFLWIPRKPWGGWLVPVSRSGHITQNVNVAFRAPDDPEQAEGVAGKTWALDTIIPVDRLPDVSGDCSDAEYQDYAKRTWVDVDWLRQEKSTARSLLGMTVKVKGQIWGVIVVDSRAETIANQDTVIQSYGVIAKVLGKLLERA